MKNHGVFRTFWYSANILLIVSLLTIVYSGVWEFSTRSYLKGFSDAIVPYSDSPEHKVEAILTWMRNGPARRVASDPNALALRDPEQTLNYKELLEVCGTATNAFVNLAASSGLESRRLLLLDENRSAKHVVAEVLIDGTWAVADPSYRILWRSPAGKLLSREELRDETTFRLATQASPNYPPNYTFESTVHIRLGRIPILGRHLRRVLTAVWPAWEEQINWTLLAEREPFALLTVSILLFFFALVWRLLLGWYGVHRLGIARVRLRDQFIRAGGVLLSNSK